MKKILLLAIVLINYKNLFAQYNSTTGYYDYAPPPQSFTASNDSGMSICKLSDFSMYATAGGYKIGTYDQGIRIGVYNINGTMINDLTYNLTGYKETAVKIVAHKDPNYWTNAYAI